MSDIHLFHPDSIPTEELRIQLKLRLPKINLGLLEREELVKIFKSYAAPMHKRSKHANIGNNQLQTKPEPNVETLTDACKKIKFSNTQDDKLGTNKRPHNNDQTMAHSQPKRKKITWP